MINTQRLIIKNPSKAELGDIYELSNSEFVLKYNCMKKTTREEFIKKAEKYSSDSFYIYLAESGEAIGAIFSDEDTLRYGVQSRCISYYLGQEFTGEGYMREALSAFVKDTFENTDLQVISARVFAENSASVKLLKAVGFTNEGCLRHAVKGYNDIIYDDMLFSILKGDIKA